MRFNPELKRTEPAPETDFETVQKEIGVAFLTLEGAREVLTDIGRDLRKVGADEPGKAELEEVWASLMRRTDAERQDLQELLDRAQMLAAE